MRLFPIAIHRLNVILTHIEWIIVMYTFSCLVFYYGGGRPECPYVSRARIDTHGSKVCAKHVI